MKKRQEKNKNLLLEQYSQSWSFLKKSWEFILIGFLIFLIFVALGFFFPTPSLLENEILKIVKELIEKTQGMSAFELIKFIFLNNVQSSFLAVILGVFFGFFPIVVAISNGYLLGFVAQKTVMLEGILVLWRIFPHGIFELPAIFISIGLGLKFSTFVFKEDKGKKFREYFWNVLRVFFFIVVPLLIIAAIIEGYLIFFVT